MKRKLALAMVLAMTATMAQPVLADSSAPVSLDVIISQYGTQTQAWWTQFEKDFEAENPDIDHCILERHLYQGKYSGCQWQCTGYP